MPLMDGNASLVANSAVSASAGVFVSLSGTDGGVATTSNATIRLGMLLSGRDGGHATTLDAIVNTLSGSTTGLATTSSPNLFELQLLSGSTTGFATLSDSAPLPIFGTGGGSAFLNLVVIPLPVDCVPRPLDEFRCSCTRHFNLFTHPPFTGTRNRSHDRFVPGGGHDECGCSRECSNPCVPKEFRWGHMFTLGDLMLYLREGGNPISPFSVTYTMFQVYPGGATIQAGPDGKRAVMQNVGVYYATGTSGENGQPGNWLVHWCYTRTFGGSSTTVDYSFKVVDSVSKPIPGDTTCRQKKYGWF